MDLLYPIIPIGGFALMLLIYHIRTNKPVLTGPASIVSRRVEVGKVASFSYGGGASWNYFVTFRLNGGDEIELSVGEQEYRELKEGLSGQLCWQGTDFRSFETREEN